MKAFQGPQGFRLRQIQAEGKGDPDEPAGEEIERRRQRNKRRKTRAHKKFEQN